MAGAAAARAAPAAPVVAVAAGCDVPLCPEDCRGVIAALDRAVGSEIPPARADEALARYADAVETWTAGADQGLPDLAAHGAFGDGLADRAVHVLRGEAPALGAPLAVSIVDDDVGGPYAVGPREVFIQTLRDAGVPVAQRATGNAQPIVLVYAEPRSWKGRAELGAAPMAPPSR